jgi:hypothetical protein
LFLIFLRNEAFKTHDSVPYFFHKKIVLLRIWLETFADDLFIIHLIVNITSSWEEGEGQEQDQGNAHVHPAPRTVFISVSSSKGP